MANLKLLWRNLLEQSTLSGGSWSLPINNIKTTDINDVARSAGLSTSQSTFIIDFGSNYTLFNAIALVNLNCSVLATVQIRTSNDASFATWDYSSGFINVFDTSLTTADTQWKSGNWWWGRITDADLDGYVKNRYIELDERENRYVQVTINDATNAAGFVSIGRAMIGLATNFINGMNWGAKTRWIDPSIKTRSIGGKPFADARPKYREAVFSLDWITDAEAMTQVFELERIVGTTGEVFVMPDSDDVQNIFKRSFLANLSELTGLDKIMLGYSKTTYTFQEIL